MPKNAKKSLALFFLPKNARRSQKVPNLRFLALKMPSWQPCISPSLFGVVAATNHSVCFMSTPAGVGIRQRNKESLQKFTLKWSEKKNLLFILFSLAVFLCVTSVISFFSLFPFFSRPQSICICPSLSPPPLFFWPGLSSLCPHPSSPSPPPALDNKTHQKEEDHMFADREGERKRNLSLKARSHGKIPHFFWSGSIGPWFSLFRGRSTFGAISTTALVSSNWAASSKRQNLNRSPPVQKERKNNIEYNVCRCLFVFYEGLV